MIPELPKLDSLTFDGVAKLGERLSHDVTTVPVPDTRPKYQLRSNTVILTHSSSSLDSLDMPIIHS
jgi:hypothetical protein